ncbi:MAG: hypothetical protein M8353_08520 [ANME-2 cluster archaeon]|nr:hypothetical protein [ANME-2 cluster archaeon]
MIFISTSISGCIKESGGYSHITVFRAREMIDHGGVDSIDVRIQEEYDKGREGELSITACEILQTMDLTGSILCMKGSLNG